MASVKLMKYIASSSGGGVLKCKWAVELALVGRACSRGAPTVEILLMQMQSHPCFLGPAHRTYQHVLMCTVAEFNQRGTVGGYIYITYTPYCSTVAACMLLQTSTHRSCMMRLVSSRLDARPRPPSACIAAGMLDAKTLGLKPCNRSSSGCMGA